MEDPDTDPEAEWSIQEYSSKENSCKLRWILNKGLTVGKKILVTGFVIASAPIVLPPLAVVSIIGFACSVPYGLFLASYTCTDKLMSKLLQESKPPPFLLEYGMVSSPDEVVEGDKNGGEGEDMGLNGNGDINRDEDEEEMLEDTRKNVEMRIALVESDVADEYGQGGLRIDGQELANDVNEILEENGYEEDVDEYVDEEEEEPTKEIELKIEGVGEEAEKQHVVNEAQAVVVDIEGDEKSHSAVAGAGTTFEVSNIVVELYENDIIEENGKFERETKGLQEKIRHEGMDDNVEEHKKTVQKPYGDAEEGDLRVDSHIGEMGMPFEAGNYFVNVRKEKPLSETDCKIEENSNGETRKGSLEMPETGYGQNMDVISKKLEPKQAVGDLLATKDSDKVLEAEKPAGEVSGTTKFGIAGDVDVVQKEMELKLVLGDLSASKESSKVSRAEKSVGEKGGKTDVGSNTAKEQEPVVFKPSMSQGGIANYNLTNDAQEDFQFNRKKEIVIFSSADAREIADESGFDDNTVAAQPYSDVEINTVGGEHDLNDTGFSSQKDINMASSKVLLNEEKIWEQIEAMRTIVGYKAARQVTCLEELKSLYLFTGVEPPASFKDPSDLIEVNEKLRFIMSIVGVK